MKSKMFAIYDSKAEAYMQPFFAPTNAMAIRMFTDLVSDNSSQVSRHSADYTLFAIGEYDDATAQTDSFTSLVNLGTGLSYKAQELNNVQTIQQNAL